MIRPKTIWISSCAALLLVLSTASARADLIITATSVNVAPGGIGTVDFYISSTDGDTLTDFNIKLAITPLPGTKSTLKFTGNQMNPYDPSNPNAPNYVFANESTFADLGLSFFSDPTTTPPYNSTTITGGDSDDGLGATPSYVTIPATPTGPNSYLASVEFMSPMGSPSMDQFQISLVNDPGQTYFDDQNGNQLAYTQVGGLVTVGSSAVPEPASLLLFMIGGCPLLYSLRGRFSKAKIA